jgi:hypothetical protein
MLFGLQRVKLSGILLHFKAKLKEESDKRDLSLMAEFDKM